MAKVLVVDDDKAVRDSLQALLSLYGHVVGTAANGFNALKMVGQDRPDAVVTDIHMPGMDGIELIVHLRRLAPDLPVVAISGALGLGANLSKAAAEGGAAATLEKPFSADALLRALAKVCPSADWRI